ncbi:MAG: helix-turn-helix transcriptional regulator [Clostridia bacterium]|nr:helix-turn-helix transcriptional regulator [Clostridia bacterium]
MRDSLQTRKVHRRINIIKVGEADLHKTQVPEIDEETLAAFKNGLQKLTKTEKIVFDCYVAGKSSKEVMAELVITENTLKFHNRNIYGKLGVPSRKRLIEIYSYYNHTN